MFLPFNPLPFRLSNLDLDRPAPAVYFSRRIVTWIECFTYESRMELVPLSYGGFNWLNRCHRVIQNKFCVRIGGSCT